MATKPISTQIETQMAVVLTKLEYIATDLTELKHNVEGKYVTNDRFNAEFTPIKKLVYLVVGLVVASIVTAGLAFLVRTK